MRWQGSGLDIACAVMQSEKEQLMESGQPWGVSLLAQEAGVAALSEQAYADRVRKTGGTTASDSGKGFAAGRIYSLGGKSQLSVVSQSRWDAWKKEWKKQDSRCGTAPIIITCSPGTTGLQCAQRKKTVGFWRHFLCQGKKQL